MLPHLHKGQGYNFGWGQPHNTRWGQVQNKHKNKIGKQQNK
jgi:hypothetical protein